MTATAKTACSCRACRAGLVPFTVGHFERWAYSLVLDNGRRWRLEPFQLAFVDDLFAGRPENWLVLPEGNAKTTLLAGLALYHIQHRADAYALVAASSRDQGEVLYRQAEGFVKRSSLSGFRCLEGYRRIRYDAQNSRIQVFAADDRTGDGVIPTLGLIDELHRHRDLRLYRTWRGKIDKRRGQIVAISTAGEPGSEFEAARERIRTEAPDVIRHGSFTRAASPTIVMHEYAVPEGADVTDLAVVKQANPLRAITIRALREKLASPTMTLVHWRRFVCDLPTRGEMTAITERQWAAANPEDDDHRIPEGESIWLGLDVAWKWDTTAAVPFWLPEEQRRIFGPALVFVPPRDGTTLDPRIVKRGLIVLHQRNPVHTVVMDMSRAEDLAGWIEETLGATVIDRSQSPAAAVEDYERFMEALGNGWLLHQGDQALTRHVLNAVAKTLPYGDVRFDRSSATRQGGDQELRVIDALTAAAMVHTEATRIREPEPAAPAHDLDPRRILI